MSPPVIFPEKVSQWRLLADGESLRVVLCSLPSFLVSNDPKVGAIRAFVGMQKNDWAATLEPISQRVRDSHHDGIHVGQRVGIVIIAATHQRSKSKYILYT